MIDPARLLADLQRLLKRLEDDIRRRVQDNASIDSRLREQYEKARAANRTAQAYEVWRDDYITQVAVAWILGCVFVRFLEDNGLIETAWLAGPGERLQLARDQHTLYFQRYPSHSDREYLEHVFAETAKLPSMRDLLDGDHNPLTKLGPTGDGANELLEFWRKIDPATGTLIHNFTDPEWNTRFLGNLYQDLSETARERYALLQTPEFIEEFILDRTLNPAIEEFGYATVKMIDPACGSGHFLLGGFRRLLELRLRHEPAVPVRAQVQAALDQVYGVDVNPFAVAIARFRLLMAGLQACGVKKLAEAPGFTVNVAAGDSLLHGPSPRGLVGVQRGLGDDPLQHYYDIEDADRVHRFLAAKYQVVVGNPPYVKVKDRALSQAYRLRFSTCYMKYPLAVPFMERMVDLAVGPTEDINKAGGYIGQITANSFMRRQFGKRLVESYLARWDLTHIIDTSRAHIPGHGTPTVILLARKRPPLAGVVRTVMGIRAEDVVPEDPSRGKVWVAITEQWNNVGSQSEFVSVSDVEREKYAKHPWAIGGGGLAELKDVLDEAADSELVDKVADLGITAVTGNDDVYVFPNPTPRHRRRFELWASFVTGDVVRDWVIHEHQNALWTYDAGLNVVGLASVPMIAMDLPPVLRQPVKTQNPSNGELSHGIVS